MSYIQYTIRTMHYVYTYTHNTYTYYTYFVVSMHILIMYVCMNLYMYIQIHTYIMFIYIDVYIYIHTCSTYTCFQMRFRVFFDASTCCSHGFCWPSMLPALRASASLGTPRDMSFGTRVVPSWFNQHSVDFSMTNWGFNQQNWDSTIKHG